MFDTLSYIGEKLNEGRVLWGVGASILLNHYGLIAKPNDIDILVHTNDIEKADAIFKRIGKKKEQEKIDTYSTKYFYEYTVDGFEIDVMAGLRINYDNEVFKYIFDKRSISDIKKINEVSIPLTSLEDWYVIYQLIPNREEKVNLIEKYLLSNGVKNRALLERALEEDLPREVMEKVKKVLNK